MLCLYVWFVRPLTRDCPDEARPQRLGLGLFINTIEVLKVHYEQCFSWLTCLFFCLLKFDLQMVQ